MRQPNRAAALALAAALGAAGLGGCGDEPSAATADRPSDRASASTTTEPSPSVGEGEWLLRFTTAGGADGERIGAVYVRYDPATGSASARRLPAATATDAGPEEEALLVSADHARAIQDTGVPIAEARSGKLVLYSTSDESTETLDIRAATGEPGLVAVGWAFDPVDADLLRVVDADRRVWKVDLAATTATLESTLPRRAGWIFGNGFDRNTGRPYIESIDSDETEPAGNGDSDTRPVERQAGTLFRYDGAALDGLPEPPCDFAGGFRSGDGTSWLFCADTPSIRAYGATEGDLGWQQIGTPSPEIVPGSVVDMSFALPPVS